MSCDNVHSSTREKIEYFHHKQCVCVSVFQCVAAGCVCCHYCSAVVFFFKCSISFAFFSVFHSFVSFASFTLNDFSFTCISSHSLFDWPMQQRVCARVVKIIRSIKFHELDPISFHPFMISLLILCIFAHNPIQIEIEIEITRAMVQMQIYSCSVLCNLNGHLMFTQSLRSVTTSAGIY